MKTSRLFISLLIIFFFFLFTSTLAQNINVHEMLGKNLNQVISVYGKPAHQDRSNPAMECLFYKTEAYQMVFVANKEGVFQAEGCKTFNSKTAAENQLNKIISECLSKGFETDTLNASEFNVHKPGVKMILSIFENNYSQKYEVKVKANKSES